VAESGNAPANLFRKKVRSKNLLIRFGETRDPEARKNTSLEKTCYLVPLRGIRVQALFFSKKKTACGKENGLPKNPCLGVFY